MSSPIGSTGGRLGSDQMAQLARDLYRMGPAGRRALKARMADLAGPLVADARARASWSSRIPGAISARVILRDDRIGLQLRVSAEAAPHARPYEGLVTPNSFRHPVHGHTDRWVTQRTRPFAEPAIAAKAAATRQALIGAYEDAARDAGFR